MQTPLRPLTHGDAIDRASALLCLIGALEWAEDNGLHRTELSLRGWLRLVECLDPREVCVVALKGVRGCTNQQIGEWLGDLSKTMADAIWHRACEKLRAAGITL